MRDNAKEHFLQHKRRYTQLGVLFVILIGLFIGYSRGYRITNKFTIGKVGYVTLTVAFPDTSVFIDKTTKITTTKDNEVLTIPLSPSKHSVILSHIGFYPWTKSFIVPSEKNIEIFPLFVSNNPSGQIITDADPEYWKIKNAIVRDVLPTKYTPLISQDNSAQLWTDDNAIIVTIASSTYTVIQPDTVVKNVSFYKNRNDVVVFSTQNGVYAIEVIKDGTQNFMPIYKGTDPYFIAGSNDFIYIEDNTVLMQVII